jgi:hypothetical protein
LGKAPAFGKAPAIGLPRPKAGVKSRTSFTVTQEWTATALPSTWQVKEADLEAVPMDFPLERTHREIQGDPSEIAKRISDTLHKLSIDAEYESTKAKCKTNECVKFRIRLYAGGENGQPVVVEVQRRCGPASSFMQSCRAVLNAAEGNETKEPVKKGPPQMMPLSAMKCLQSATLTKPSSPEEDAKAAFDAAANLCKSERRDSAILGLQNLRSLTDPLKTSTKVAVLVSQWILFGDEANNTRGDVSSLMQVEVHKDEDIALQHSRTAETLCFGRVCKCTRFVCQRWLPRQGCY